VRFANPFLLRVCCALFFSVFSLAAFGGNSHDRTQFRNDITIGPNDEATEVTCFGCNVRVRGRVSGDVTTFGGSIQIEDQAEVNGDATSFAGGLRLDGGAKVDGDVTVFGGKLRRDSAASIGGDVTNFGGGFWVVLVFGLPLIILGALIALVIWLVRLMLRRGVPATA
jgi:cytoskeletal protein CcmA (bactofilin family)